MVFTLEPGVYLEGRFGVRHEDVFLVREEGEAECLSGRRAGSAWDP
jgi:Xaa-Pro aminopeptidase